MNRRRFLAGLLGSASAVAVGAGRFAAEAPTNLRVGPTLDTSRTTSMYVRRVVDGGGWHRIEFPKPMSDHSSVFDLTWGGGEPVRMRHVDEHGAAGPWLTAKPCDTAN